MPRLDTLKDLMVTGDLSMGEARNLTKTVFDGETTLNQAILPYNITMPAFDDLADHIQQFLIKAMLEAKVVNFLDAKDNDNDPDNGSIYGLVREDADLGSSDPQDIEGYEGN